MMEWRPVAIMLLPVMISMISQSYGKDDIEGLKAEQKIADFRVESVYENEAGASMGARFRHVPSGFVLDLLRIQSVPQAFMWVNSFPTSDMGEPHTCEHLMLGKGTRGRYVASLEEMSLGSSSAFTGQLQTCYHFHTAAGAETFYKIMEAKLNAFVHPNFSDEEIKREVCNMGYTIDPSDSTLRLEEKGTVYNEMVRSFESPWANLDRQMGLMLYGPGHPLSNESGGYPDAIRAMAPQDMWKFIGDNYHLSNMGMIVSIPDDISLNDCLKQTGAILNRIEPEAKPGVDPTTKDENLPLPQSAPPGSVQIVDFPSQNEKTPGLLLFAWPPVLDYDNNEGLMLDLFLSNLASGETSELYHKFVDSQTRVMDIGANNVFEWISDNQGHAVYVGFGNVNPEAMTEATIDSVRSVILDEIKRVANMDDGSRELAVFNGKARDRVIERRRDLRDFLNSPPGFGYRGASGRWFDHVKLLQKDSGFRKKLGMNEHLKFAEDLLASGRNFWKEYIRKWGILDTPPYAVASKPNPEMIHKSEEARAERISAFEATLETEFGTNDLEEALGRFRADYDAQTRIIDSVANQIVTPKFIDNPPMTLDDQLHYTVEKLPGGGPLVTSTFDNMTSGAVGLAFRMDVVPESLLVYTAALPVLLTEVGVIKDGQLMAYDQMKEALRREIKDLRAYYSVNYRTQRVELVVRAAGSDMAESQAAIGWLKTALFYPDWREENLPRIRDVVDQTLGGLRTTMRGPEEAWTYDPASAYWRQTNPLLLTTDCFLTQIHAFHRLRWLLKDAGSNGAADEFTKYMNELASFAGEADRDDMGTLLAVLLEDQTVGESTPPAIKQLAEKYSSLPEESKALVSDAARDLKLNLADIPDASLGKDMSYLCGEMAVDLKTPAEQALIELALVLDLVRAADNARAFMVTSSANQKALRPLVADLAAGLNPAPSARRIYDNTPLIISRLQDHAQDAKAPIFVGLINSDTRSGVIVNTAPCASFVNHDDYSLLRFLSARLYGGGGAHSMFMKTWGAGLAYSNGLRSNEMTGRLIYYAERCPDIAQTMQFVVSELRTAPRDSSLAEYAVAQAFAVYRSASKYETRGEAIASDLADGVTPDAVRRFRKRVLELRQKPDLYDRLYSLMEPTYGTVLLGYGPRADSVKDAVYFVIGPEAQFQSYEKYLHGVEGDLPLYRLYPRDYWIVRPGS